MSSLTRCNFCTLKRIKKNVGKKKVSLVPNTSMGLGGYDVFVYPKDVSLEEAKKEHDAYWTCWFMSVSDECCC